VSTDPVPIERITPTWRRELPLVGMVHLLPLPGAPRWRGSMAEVLERAAAEAQGLAEAGLDGLLVENFLDAPFHPDTVPPETVAALALAVVAVMRAAPSLPVGVNVLRNDAAAAVGIAAATGAAFVRINVHTGAMLTDQGWISGRAHETVRQRARLQVPVSLWADVLVKHAVAPTGLRAVDAARDTWERGLADALIVTGWATGAGADPERIRAVRGAVPEAPLWVGSGLTPDNAPGLLEHADGGIVGSSLRRGGRAGADLDPARAAALVAAVDLLRDARGR
jgi:uncharacterized protein